MNILKSIGAVLAGLVFIVISHTAVDKILEGLGIFPDPEQGLHVTWMLLLASRIGPYCRSSVATSPPCSLHHDRCSTLSFSVFIGLVVGMIAAVAVIPESKSGVVSDRPRSGVSSVRVGRRMLAERRTQILS
jgi:hypothetical protein